MTEQTGSELGYLQSLPPSVQDRVGYLTRLVKQRGELQALPWLLLFCFVGLGIASGAEYAPVDMQSTITGIAAVIGTFVGVGIYFTMTRPLVKSIEESLRSEIQGLDGNFLRELAERSGEFAPVFEVVKQWL